MRGVAKCVHRVRRRGPHRRRGRPSEGIVMHRRQQSAGMIRIGQAAGQAGESSGAVVGVTERGAEPVRAR